MKKYWLNHFKCAAWTGNDRFYILPMPAIGVEKVGKNAQWFFAEIYFFRLVAYVEFRIYYKP